MSVIVLRGANLSQGGLLSPMLTPPAVAEGLRLQLNARRLLMIDETIRELVRRVLTSMEWYGFRPLIHSDVWRSPRKQLELFNRGVSKLRWGFHCASRDADGDPMAYGQFNGAVAASLAADIIDANYKNGWDAPRQFWATLGYCAEMNGLGWGGYFGLSSDLKTGLKRYVRSKETMLGLKSGKSVPGSLKMGWDVAHIETARVTVAEARRGLR